MEKGRGGNCVEAEKNMETERKKAEIVQKEAGTAEKTAGGVMEQRTTRRNPAGPGTAASNPVREGERAGTSKEKETERKAAESTRNAGFSEKGVEEEGREIDKRQVVNVELEGQDAINMNELLRAIESTCGKVLGCRAKGDKKWEITMSNIRGKERLLDGFKIRGTAIMATEVVRDQRVVSFLNLPLYITDNQIRQKLDQWGVEVSSLIKRKKWAGTDIYDGTRYMKVKFTETVSSLPYSTKFETLEGIEYFRVIHDNQQRVCRLCMQPGHILRECPEFKCYRCNGFGHYARECGITTARCTDCRKPEAACKCAEKEKTYTSVMMEEGGEEASEMEEEDEDEEEDEGEEEEAAAGSGAGEGKATETQEQKERAEPEEERRGERKETETETEVTEKHVQDPWETSIPKENRLRLSRSRSLIRGAEGGGGQSSGALSSGQVDSEKGQQTDEKKGQRKDSEKDKDSSDSEYWEKQTGGGKGRRKGRKRIK